MWQNAHGSFARAPFGLELVLNRPDVRIALIRARACADVMKRIAAPMLGRLASALGARSTQVRRMPLDAERLAPRALRVRGQAPAALKDAVPPVISNGWWRTGYERSSRAELKCSKPDFNRFCCRAEAKARPHFA
jgi:hypothetical protein